MLSRKFFAFLLVIKMVASQTMYPTTQVSYSTNAVPTIQTYPVSPATCTAVPASVPTVVTAKAMPATATAMPATTTLTATMPATTAITATAMPATTAVTATPMPVTATAIPASMPIVTLTATPITASPVTSSPTISAPKADPTEPKAYFLPANIPDPKVTILSNDLPTIIEVKPTCLGDTDYVKASLCPDRSQIIRKDSGPMTAVKRVTMACTDDFISSNEQPLCPGIPKMDVTPTPVVSKDLKSNPIDFEGLLDSFMTCL